MRNNDTKNTMIRYYVMYKTENPAEKIDPVIKVSYKEAKDLYDTYHMFPLELKNLLDILPKIYQLPRTGMDIYDLPFDIVDKSVNTPHDIFIFPDVYIDLVIENYNQIYKDVINPAVLIYDDVLENFIDEFEQNINPILGCHSFSNFQAMKPSDIWNDLGNYFGESHFKKVKYPNQGDFLSNNFIEITPALFFAIQSKHYDYLFKSFDESENKTDVVSSFLDKVYAINKTYCSILPYMTEDEEVNKTMFKEEQIKQYKVNHKPVVLTYPGIPNKQAKNMRAENTSGNYEIEKFSIKTLGIHRAIAQNALYIELPRVEQELYNLLFSLEQHCLGSISNKFIWSTLEKIGKLFSNRFTDKQLQNLQSAKKVSYFSEYPIGIAILPDTTAPLNCYTNLSGKGLTPLIRGYQKELPRIYDSFKKGKCKIALAECLKIDDRIRKASDKGWNIVEDQCENSPYLEFVRKDTSTVYQLKTFLRENEDADILIISAHGHYEKTMNVAGILVGDEFWFAGDNDFMVPETVILSACHVSPKSMGSVNVSDLFLRSGAKCVLGTLIPIDVYRNATLMNRLILYINETLKGETNFYTLDEIWSQVVTSNAIVEILETSNKLKKWAFKSKNGVTPISRFMLEDDSFKIRKGHVYQDSIEKLKLIAKEDGLDTYIDAIMKSKGVFPESIFYTLNGYPELIYFQIPDYLMNR